MRTALIRYAGAALLALLASQALAGTVKVSHGVSVFGDLKYGADFAHFDYVNPDAPKGGTLRLWGLDTFETLNPFILKGRKEAWNALIFDTLMARAFDEPDALYGLVAEAVEIPEEGGWVAFRLRPEARFHDGTPITADDVAFTYRTLVEKGHPQFRILFRDVAGVEAVGRHKVRFAFKPGRHRDLPVQLAALPVLSKAYYATVAFEKTTFTPAAFQRALSRRQSRAGTVGDLSAGARLLGRATCRSIADATISTASRSTTTATATSPSRRSSPASTTSARSSRRGAGRPSTTSRRCARG